MIPVEMFPPPAHYEEEVKRKGEDFLKKNPAADLKAIRNRKYWKVIRKDLRRNYKSVCSFSAQWCGCEDNVEHYIPLSWLVANNQRHRAYHWDNFRYASRSINENKGASLDVVDPFQVEYGWFRMEFPSLIIFPGKNLEQAVWDKVYKTIEILKLNEDSFVECRKAWVDAYVSSCKSSRERMPTDFNNLKVWAPFLAYELERQQKQEEIIHDWKGIK